MIRLITCIYRRQEMTPEDFRRHWRSIEFDLLVGEMQEFFGAESARRSLVLNIDLTTWLNQFRGTDNEPPDGIIEYSLSRGEGIERALDTPEAGAIITRMCNFQHAFIDTQRTFAFFVEG